MKKSSTLRVRIMVAALLVSGFALPALAQKEKESKSDGQVNVKIIERDEKGELREESRSYRLNGLKDDERDAMVTKLVDSLRAKHGEKGQITIIVEDGDHGSHIIQRDGNGNRVEMRQGNRQRNKDLYAKRPNDPLQFRYYKDGKLQRQYRLNPDSLADRLKRFEFNFPNNWTQRMDDSFRNWNNLSMSGESSSTIRSLQVYPNNPEKQELNVRFTAPAKGDIKIRVTTPDGKEVAHKEVKDFSGSYSGQIDLGKKAKGTYFVSVTQKEDGAVKRVVINE
ncbi:T9SS type A sorting domain-containing protein [Tellurirhabdus bombi]|uniref:T9SS type A sorting domain-containing protein n=1 Tax=Tellurirhabdus bombi TaxID=2907205 RepID=UPI001F227ABA|nr:T9SS type A sorting domain-containing protein [Tellurirhabdus bombi]